MEKALPKEHQKYKNRCLPEGEYPCSIDYAAFEYKGMTIHAPFISIDSVPYFRNADFFTHISSKPPKDAICLGTARDSLFGIVTAHDDVVRFLARLSKRLFDEQRGCSREPVTLIIRRADDIIYEDTSVEQIEKRLAYEKEMMEKAAILDELS